VLVPGAGQPLLLRPGLPFSFGRAKECNLTIPSKRVSREHAFLRWREGFPVICDQSENNPTLVNGSNIAEHELRDGDEIKIGPYSCTYRLLGPNDRLDLGINVDADTEVSATDAAMEGNLSKLGLRELLLTFEAQEKTGTIDLIQGNVEGRIILDSGRFESAILGDDQEDKAVVALLAWTEGTFRFSNEKKTAKFKIIRKFDYSAGGMADPNARRRRFKGRKISDFLDDLDAPPVEKPKRRPPRDPDSDPSGRRGRTLR
jgi:pSer/pThr/pTyr-binding forkhead associated (FHA) protein